MNKQFQIYGCGLAGNDEIFILLFKHYEMMNRSRER